MPTFQILQDRVARRVIDLPASVVTEVPDLINKAMRTLQEQHDFRVMKAETAQLITIIATHNFTTSGMPTNFKGFRDGPYLFRNDGSLKDLRLAANRVAVWDVYSQDPNDKGEPETILVPEPSDDTGIPRLGVFPFADGLSDYSDGEYRVIIPYWRYVAALSAGTDENWFTTNAEWYLVFQATAEAFFLDWDEARGQLWATRAGDFAPDGRSVGEFARVLKQDKLTRLSTVRSLSFSLGVFSPQLRS